jgi:diguanylate cyclase (GGDEF)-like protein
MDSKIGLVIQFTGIFLITVLSLLLRRSLKSVVSGYWLAAWSSLSVALFCLSLAFNYTGDAARLLFVGYFLGEYFFGLMLIAGCQSLSGDAETTTAAAASSPRRRRRVATKVVIMLSFAGIAVWLACAAAASDFNLVFNLHALILSVFFAAAFIVLRHSQIKTFGWRVMRVALFLLALDFFHYFVVFMLASSGANVPPLLLLPLGYLTFNPIIDLVLEIQLGFGMVIVLLEKVLGEARLANEKLREAHEKLEQLAQTDPLTTAFNRHAFHGYLKKRDGKEISGCVGFFDIDDLKPINDLYGHAAGDMAIRAVVGAIRAMMRAEDLIFRWGGDEFFVIMVGMNAEMARARMSRLENLLTDIQIEGASGNLSIGVSYGFQDFAVISELEQAVEAADEEMYRRKQERKRQAGRQTENTNFYWPPPIQESGSRVGLP